MALIKVKSRGTDNVTGRKNIVINGAMQVAQRGTSFTGLGNGDNGYKLDRFKFAESGSPNGEFTLTQSTDAPNGFGYSMKLDCTTAETSLASNEMIRIIQGIEGQNLQSFKKGTSDAESMTVSFYVKSNLTGDAVVALYDQDNTRYNAKTYTINTANTWERKTLTFQPDTTGSFDNNNESSMELWFFLQAGSQFKSGSAPSNWETYTEGNLAVGQDINIASSTSNEFLITGIQLEVSEQATDFEHRSFAEELQLCKRYYYKLGGDTAYQTVNTVVNFIGGTMLGHYQHPVQMRAAATITKTGNWATLGGDTTVGQTVSADQNGPKTVQLGFSGGSGGTSGRASTLRWSNDINANLQFSAEL
tara:strand:+ start:609 stop:1691 length:1083 start_codon:yes stop_codon:yes gene_type:complete